MLLLALDGYSHHFVADYSVIQDPFDIGVVFWLLSTPRVKVCGIQPFWGNNNEYAILVSAKRQRQKMLEKNDDAIWRHLNYYG
jgi:hypothetical protein